jgi:hypothetical protein
MRHESQGMPVVDGAVMQGKNRADAIPRKPPVNYRVIGDIQVIIQIHKIKTDGAPEKGEHHEKQQGADKGDLTRFACRHRKKWRGQWGFRIH